MFIRIGYEITIECVQPTPMLMALYPHPSNDRRMIGTDKLRTEPEADLDLYTDGFSNCWVRMEAPPGTTNLWSDCLVADTGQPDEFNWDACQHEIMDLPSETLPFLTASRYCESDELSEPAWELFGSTQPGWARVQAISNWVHNHTLFDYRFGRPTKTAGDVFKEGTGVCRDFAHLFIALCRAMNIPARYASGYLCDVVELPGSAGDFCAWAEVFVGGRWYTFDARHNTPRVGRILMVYGRDAADVPMITGFGQHRLTYFKVWTNRVDPAATEADLLESLQTRPDSDAMVLGESSERWRL